MLDFTSQLDDLFLAVYNFAIEHARQELVSAAVLLTALIIVVFIHARASERLSEASFRFNRYARFTVNLIFPLLYFLIVGYLAGYLGGDIATTVFASVAYFYVGYNLIRSLVTPLEGSYVPWSLISYVLLCAVAALVALIDINAIVYESEEIERAFYLAYKVSLLLLIYVFILSAIKHVSGLIPESRKFLKSTTSSLLGFVSVIYLIVAALWLFQIIGFASSMFVGGVVIFIAIVFYGFLKTYSSSYLDRKIGHNMHSYGGVKKSVATFLDLLLVYILFVIFLKYYNLSALTSYLSSLYVINTQVIRLSVYSIISGLYVFFFLLSVVGILKHMVYFLNVKRGYELQAGSFRSLIGNIGLLIVITIALSQFGLTWTALLPVAGALGIGIGIGLQDIMKNYISGLIILFSKRLKIGDVIEIEGNAGRAIGNKLETIYGSVESIDTFSSVIATTDSIEIVVPNSQFIEQQIVNYSLSHATIRVRIPFGVSYASDPNKVREILIAAAKEHDKVLKNPEPNVWFTEYADSAIVFYLLIWVNIRQLWKINPVISDLYFRVWYEFEKQDIVIPFPQQDVWFKNNLKVEIDRAVGEMIEKEKEENAGGGDKRQGGNEQENDIDKANQDDTDAGETGGTEKKQSDGFISAVRNDDTGEDGG